MKTFSNTSEIDKILETLTRQLLERVSKEVLEDFLRDYIEEQVYGVNKPKVYSSPKGSQFRDIWDFSEVKKFSNHLETLMEGDWTKLSTPSASNPFAHGSYSPSFPKDTRQILERLLNMDGRTPNQYRPDGRLKWISNEDGDGGTARDSKPYWDNFKKDYVKSGRLQRVIDKHAKALGFTNIGGFTSVSMND